MGSGIIFFIFFMAQVGVEGGSQHQHNYQRN
jgi:hypothetical protein